LIESKRLFLEYLLKDLKKDDEILRRHLVEYILLFDALIANANAFQAQLPLYRLGLAVFKLIVSLSIPPLAC
jgi:hypothetical protein